jgi:hypothetical protein
MKEQSHKDEMSAALRGDFRRLRERGVAVALAPHEPDADLETPPDAEEQPPPEPSEHDEPQDTAPVIEPEASPERAPQRRGWLSRFAGR